MIRTRQSNPSLRSQGRLIEALLIFLKQLTAHSRWVFVALLVLYAISGIHTIQPEETALVRRLGQLQDKLHGPGLLVTLPRPFDEVLRFETGKDNSIVLEDWQPTGSKIADPDKPIEISDEEMVRRRIARETVGGSVHTEYEIPPDATLDPVVQGYTLTSDFNVIQGSFALRFRIADPFDYVTAGDNIDELLRCLSYQALARQIASQPINALLTNLRQDIGPAVAQDVQAAADHLGLGLQVTGFDVRTLTPPSQVLAAFEDVTTARQVAKTLIENARQYESEMRAKSEGEAAAIGHRAGSYAQNTVEAARGEANAFRSLLVNYSNQPVLVARRLLRESLDTAFQRVNSRTLLPTETSQPTLVLEPAPEFAR